MATRFEPGAGSVHPLIDRSRRCLAASEAGDLPSKDPTLASCTPKEGGASELYSVRLAQARRPSYWRTQISELQTLFTSTSQEVTDPPSPFGDRPVSVLTADLMSSGATPEAREMVNAYWSLLHQEVARISTRGREERVPGSGHLIMLERPDVVISRIRDVAEASRSNIHPPPALHGNAVSTPSETSTPQ